MAKLSLGLDKNPPKAAKELPIETYETLYKKALSRMQAEPYILQSSFKRENFEQAAKMFAQLGDYEDAAALCEVCQEKVREAKEEEKAERYEKAVRRSEEAESDSEWKTLTETFADLGDYEEAPHYREVCQAGYNRSMKRLMRKRNILLGAAVILLVGIAVGTVTRGFTYLYGRSFMQAGIYGKARETLESLGDRFDAPKMALKSEYLALQHADEGATVTFAGYKWKALEKKDGRMLMMLSSLEEDSPLSGIAFDAQGKTDWKSSSLHTYLNQDFLETFGEERCGTLVEEDGDKVTIFSAQQLEQYAEEVTTKTDLWLSTPGKQDGTQMIRLASGRVLEEGIATDSTQISAMPVILVDYAQGIEEG